MRKSIYFLVISFFLSMAVFSGVKIYDHFKDVQEQENLYDSLAQIVEQAETAPAMETAPSPSEHEEDPPENTEPVILPAYAELYEQNSDMVGWICIEDTRVNYPVMQSPYDSDFYLNHGFDKGETDYGCPYVSTICDVAKPSDNLIIYGHHKKNGSMFSDLKKELTKLSLAEYFCEVAAVVCPTEQEAEEHLRLILNALYLLSKGDVPELLIKSAVEMRLASISGYMPDLLMCPRCGLYEGEEMYFLLSGQIFCKECFEKSPLPQGIRISKSLALALRHLVFAEDKKLFSFSLSEGSLKLLSDITEEYLSRKVERNFATLQFYKTVSN